MAAEKKPRKETPVNQVDYTAEAQIKEALRVVPLPEDPTKWDDDILLQLCCEIRKNAKPMIAAMNKADIAPEGNIERVESVNDMCVVTMAEIQRVVRILVGERALELAYLHPELRVLYPFQVIIPHMRRAVELSLELVIKVGSNLAGHIETNKTHAEGFASVCALDIACL